VAESGSTLRAQLKALLSERARLKIELECVRGKMEELERHVAALQAMNAQFHRAPREPQPPPTPDRSARRSRR
jgi:hypothetical protein